MRHWNLFVTPIVLVAFGCSANASSPKQVGQSKTEEFVDFGAKFFDAIKSKPTKHKIAKVKNKYIDNQIDEWHTDTYDGYRVEFLRAKSAPGDLISSLRITDPTIKLPFGISIGNTSAQVTQILGKPSAKKGSELEYVVGDIQTASVHFTFVNDRLIAVKWSYEID